MEIIHNYAEITFVTHSIIVNRKIKNTATRRIGAIQINNVEFN